MPLCCDPKFSKEIPDASKNMMIHMSKEGNLGSNKRWKVPQLEEYTLKIIKSMMFCVGRSRVSTQS